MPLGANTRSEAVTEIRDLIANLTDCYRPERRGPMYPGLLPSLDRTRVLTSPVTPPGDGRRSAPGSRPPANIDWPSTAQDIRTQAIEWDAFLRDSEYRRTWDVALGGLSVNADVAQDANLLRLRTDARKWVRSAAILLGYLDPVLDVPQLFRGPCFDCGESQVHLVPLAMFGDCYACGSEYSTERVRALALEHERGRLRFGKVA